MFRYPLTLALALTSVATFADTNETTRLIDILRKGQWETWQIPDAARHQLAEQGASAIEPTCRAISADPTGRFFRWASAALHGVVHDARKKGEITGAQKALCRVLADRGHDARTRSLAATLLGRLGDGSASTALVQALSDAPLRASVARALGDIRAKEAAPTLRALLDKKLSRDARAACIEALGKIGDGGSIGSLAALTKSKDERIRFAALDALGQMPGGEASKLLTTATQTGDDRTKRRAALAMLRRGKALVAAGNIKALLAAGDRACQGCHAPIFADYERSLHRTKKKMTCGDCHGESVKHMEDYGETKPSKPTSKKLMVEQCGSCHFEFETPQECVYDSEGKLGHRFAWSSFKRVREIMTKVREEEPPWGMDLLVDESFDSGSLSGWATYPKGIWRVAEDGGNKALQLTRPSGFAGAVLKDYEVTDFVLTVRGRCTIKRGDIDLLFGWRDPAHLYFIHYAPFTRSGYNMIAVKNGGTRVPIHVEKKPPARLTGQEYHVLRVERYADTGEIRGYIDDLEKPIFTAVDKTFKSGLVGVGSYGDTGFFDDIRLYGKLARKRTIDLKKVRLPAARRPPKPKAPAKPRRIAKTKVDLRVPSGLKAVAADDFSSGKAERWRHRPGSKWRLAKVDGNFAYELAGSAKQGKIRAPGGMSIFNAAPVSDCCITVQARCLQKASVGGRDLCIFLGYQDPTHFYYVHFSNRSDRVHNAILEVDGKDRQPITAGKPTAARLVDQNWHQLKVERDVATGEIRAYIDDMKTPIMTAKDKTFSWGLVGVGAFDDLGYFDDVRLFGRRHAGQQKPVLP